MVPGTLIHTFTPRSWERDFMCVCEREQSWQLSLGWTAFYSEECVPRMHISSHLVLSDCTVLMITLMYYIYNWVLVITYPLLRLWQLVINGTKSTFYTCLALLALGEAFKALEPVMISKDQESHSLMTVGAANVRGFMCLGCKMWKAGFKPYSLSLENGSYFCWTAAGWGRRVFSATGWRPWTSYLL